MAPRSHAVVIGLDASDPGRLALDHAADIAHRRRLPLRLVHAFEPSQYDVRPRVGWTRDAHGVLRNASQRLVDRMVESLGVAYPELVVSVRLEPGSATQMLIEESQRAELVVLGSRGTGGFADLVVGSTTMHVASLAHCPVVAVPASSNDVTRHGVVVGVDGSEMSEIAIEFAFQMASEMGENLVAVHAWTQPAMLGPGVMLPPVYDPALVNDEERVVMAEAMAGWTEKHPDVKVETRVVRDHPVHALVAAAGGARLLVVGSRGRGPVTQLAPRFREPRRAAPRDRTGGRRALARPLADASHGRSCAGRLSRWSSRLSEQDLGHQLQGAVAPECRQR